MELNSVGNYLEAVCCGCGEPLLICSGDSVNFRAGESANIMGIEVPMPSGLLCSVCNKKENGEVRLSVKFAKLVCSSCGGELSPEDGEPEIGEDGEFKGMVCSDCSEPWRRSCQD